MFSWGCNTKMRYETELMKWNGGWFKKIKSDAVSGYISGDISEYVESLGLKGKNVIDGGGNVGLYAIYFSKLVSENGFVHSFEIQEAMCEMIEENKKMNHATNIKVYHNALSDVSGKFVGFTRINYNDNYISTVGIRTEAGLRGEPHCGNVETIALDDLNIENIGLIKLDLEGHEPEALKGMDRTIREQKPHLIIELTEGYLKHEVPHVIKKIEDMGYEMKPLSDCNYYFRPI